MSAAFSLDGRIAAVTGAASGIGNAIAAEFARAGALVHLIDRNADAVRDASNAIGDYASSCVCDVSDANAVGDCFTAIHAEGPLDILVNCAGVAHVGTIETTTLGDFDRLFRVNVQGTYLCAQAVVGGMAKRGSGVILNIASIAAWAGLADRFAYSMTKGAVTAMTLSIARDYIKRGVRCNSISPGRVHTPFVDGFIKTNYPGREEEMFANLAATQPIGRMGEPGEIASLARYLASDEAKFITGCDYAIDGGFLNLHG